MPFSDFMLYVGIVCMLFSCCKLLIKDHLGRYIGEGNVVNETHMFANYSLICVNKTSGELDFGPGEATLFPGDMTLRSGETVSETVSSVCNPLAESLPPWLR